MTKKSNVNAKRTATRKTVVAKKTTAQKKQIKEPKKYPVID